MNQSVVNLKNDLAHSTSIKETLSIFDRYLKPLAKEINKIIYGVTDGKVGLSKAKKLKQQAYDKALLILDRVKNDPSKLTENDRIELAKYSGKGGIGETTNEYYTPEFVAKGMWSAMAAMGFSGGNVLEPSAGVGVFGGNKPQSTEMTNIEYDAISSKINNLLHPDDKTINSTFEKFAVRSEHNFFDSVVGNPPFGDRDDFAKFDRTYEKMALADQYFVTRSIDLCKAGGLIILALPPRIVDAVNLSDWRKEISAKAEFLGAHLLPAGTFNSSGTATTVTVAVWRKHTEEAINLINDSDDDLLFNSNVYFDEFISGKYYENSGRKFVMGDLVYKKGNFDRIETTAQGDIDSIAIQNQLAHKFNSRINWSLFATSEPVSKKYNDGDSRMINGRLKVLQGGKWIEKNAKGQKGNTLDAKIFGVNSVFDLENLLKDNSNLKKFNVAQLKAILSVFPAFLDNDAKDIINLVLTKQPKYQDRLINGLAIGYKLNTYQEIKQQGYDDIALRDEIILMAQESFNQFGDPNKIKSLIGLNGKSSKFWNAFTKMLNENGDPNDYLKGSIETVKTGAYNSKDINTIVSYLSTNNNDSITFNDIMSLYDGEPITENDLINLDGIALTTNGHFETIDNYATGDIVQKIDQLIVAIGNTNSSESDINTTVVNKWQKQLEFINNKRDWQDFDSINLSLNAKWVDRSLILDFLHDNGFSKFTTEPHDTIDYGNNHIHGYRENEFGKKQTKENEQFHRHLENYLNHQQITGERYRVAAIKKEIEQLNIRFKEWLLINNKKDLIEKNYNDCFNRYIDKEYSDEDLGLTGLMGNIKLLGYQNQAIRRIVNDGKGLIGFQMGLGKTFTALGLVEYKYQKGLSKRCCIVVPKSTLENWYHEYVEFYGRGSEAGKNIFFVGVKPIIDKNGNVEQVPILDPQGNDTGKKKDKVELLSGKEINSRMHMIPSSNYKLVVMTKEQFSKIPMYEDTKGEYVDRMVASSNISHRQAIEAIEEKQARQGITFKKKSSSSDYFAARRKAAQQRKYGNDGIDKSEAYPYFEDMAFDSVINDEAHNYRNSYQAGRETAALAWLPTGAAAKIALDMAIKCDYIRAKNNDTGTTMLTATPLVNSPTDMFNMLSLTVGTNEWLQKYGIANVDDFVRTFGKTAIRDVETLSGSFEPREALVGFSNLKGLRNIFHKWVNFKEANDVALNVEIPDLDYRHATTEMTEEQSEIYEELREKAAWLSNATEEQKKESGITVFGLIRQMDKIATDLDLYHNQMTFLFEPKDLEKVKSLVDKLPKKIKVTNIDDDTDKDLLDDIETIEIENKSKISMVGEKVSLVVNAHFEDKVNDLINKLKIDENTITHPITPKYAKLIENVKNGLKDGKQLIFTQEKSQHEKLRRILSYHLDLPRNKIGIINADSIKKGKKNASEDDLQSGLEGIAQDFNEGRLLILICNKKAEVGINLHRGTTDVHFATIPWNPASLKQAAGRAARIGSTAKSVRIWIYESDGSFDKFRFQTLQRKSNWINDIITNKDIDEANNEDADDASLANDYLAKNDDDREKQKALRKLENEQRLKAEMERVALLNLSLFTSQAQICAVPKDDLLAHKTKLLELIKENDADMRLYGQSTNLYKDAAISKRNKKDQIRKIDNTLKQFDEAKDNVKRLKGMIKGYIDNGTLNIDRSIIDSPENFVVTGNKNIIQVGSTWQVEAIRSNNVDKKIFDIRTIKEDREADSLFINRYIAQVKKLNSALGFAVCELIYPMTVEIKNDKNDKDGLYTNTVEDIIVYLDDFIKETEFNNDELLLDNMLDNAIDSATYHKTQDKTVKDQYGRYPTMTLNKAILLKNRVGDAQFNNFIKKNKIFINATSNSSYGSSSDDNQLLIKNGKPIIVKKGWIEDAHYFVMQPVSDTDKTNIALYCINLLKEENKLNDKYFGFLLPEYQLTHIFGVNWKNEILSYGDVIPVNELAQMANDSVSEFIKENQLDKIYSDIFSARKQGDSYIRVFMDFIDNIRPLIRSIFDNKINRTYDNQQQATSTLESVINGSPILNAYRDKYNEYREKEKINKDREKLAVVEAMLDEFNAWSSKGIESAKERLSRYKNAFMADQDTISIYLDTSERDNADNAKTLMTIRIGADLSHFNDFNITPTIETNLVQELHNNHLKYNNCLVDNIDPTVEIKNDDQQVKIDEALNIPTNDEEIQKRLSGELADMRVKLAKTDIKVNAIARGKNYIAEFKSGSVIGIQDPNGFGGDLSFFFVKSKKAKEHKKEYKAVWLSTNEGEFTGGWWMIDAKSDLEKLSQEI